MKKLFLTALLAVIGFLSQAQKLEKAKDLLNKKKFTEAKTEIDNVLAVEKNKTVSEAWYVKAKVYGAIAGDSSLKATVPDARGTAFEAMKQYLELETKEKDAAKRNIQLTLDNNAPLIELYTGYSKDAASFYNASNYNDAFVNFKNSLAVFDLMSSKGIIPIKLDTTTTLYAGISAEKAQKPDDAAVYYGKIAENKAKGEGFVEIYKWLADYYRRKDDIANAAKFSALGKEVYPNDPFWTGFDLDMAREKGNKEDLFKKYEQVIKENPDNYLFLFNYGVELYQTGYDPDASKRPANSKELIAKAIEVMTKALEKKPDYANANMVLGQIYYNQGVEINNENKNIRPQGNVKLTPEQLKKKDELRAETSKKFDQALPYLVKVDELLDSQGKLKMEDKDNLKNALDLLIIINEEKVNQLEQKKRQAEAKKDAAAVKQIDADIKKLQDAVTKYTEKYNNIDRKH
jgi:tetratricopeptide (TPR) repeat protein